MPNNLEIKQKVEELLTGLPLNKMMPVEVDYVQPSMPEFEEKVKAEFSKYLDHDFVEHNFALPEDFKEYLIQCKNYYSKGSAWAYLLDAQTILVDLPYFLEIFGDDMIERKNEGKSEPADTMWIHFGGWSDKHQFVICCDKSSQVFGKVFDGHDAHPWLNEDLYGIDEVTYDSFLDFLEKDTF